MKIFDTKRDKPIKYNITISKWRYEIPVIQNQASLIITTKSQITSGITSSSINLIQGINDLTYSLEHGKILEINLPIENSNNKTLIISDVELTIFLKLNEGGVTFIKPNNSNHQGLGTIWKIPLPAGNNKINVISEDENLINLIVDGEKISERISKEGDGSIWIKNFNFSESKIITLETSRNSKLLLQTNDENNILNGIL